MSDIMIQIEKAIKESPVILYMKGNANFPMCGFSGVVVDILKKMKVDFTCVDVLQNPEIRQGIKEYSHWPTIPQLYIKGEFIGGADIVRQMYETGELFELLTKQGLLDSSSVQASNA